MNERLHINPFHKSKKNGLKNRITPLLIKPFFSFLFVFLPFHILAQNEPEPTSKSKVDDRIESIVDKTGAENDYSEFTEDLYYFKENPINLNEMQDDQLRLLIFLTDIQRRNLYDYIQRMGELLSVYELLAIDGFDRNTVDNILPYIVIKPAVKHQPIKFMDVFRYGKNQILLRYQQVLEKQQGFSSQAETGVNNKYRGSPQYYLMKYGFNYRNKIRFGFTAEKDAGEEFFKGSNKTGFDFYSGHVFLSNMGKLKTLALGDYHVQFGQGLTFWSGCSFGKSPDAMMAKHISQGIKPYTSSNENNFLRGAAFTISLKPIEVSCFFSSKKCDANIAGQDSLSTGEQLISAMQESGYHRTEGEIADEKAISMTAFGGNISVKGNNYRLGITGSGTLLNSTMTKNNDLYRLYCFEGKSLFNTGVDFNVLWKMFDFFGEAAVNSLAGLAFTCGFVSNFDQRFALTVIYRNYGEKYCSFYGNPFGEGSPGSGEEGIYLGLNSVLTRKLSFSAYADVYRFRWLKYRTDAPSNGYECYSRLTCTAAKNCDFYLSYRLATGRINSVYNEEDALNKTDQSYRHNIRLHISWNIIPGLRLGTRLECVNNKTAGNPGGTGYLAFQDAAFSFQRIPLQVSARFALFHTDSYNERIYACEPGLLYTFSVPAYYYKGSGTALMISYEIVRGVKCWVKYSHLYYSNISFISSGPELINGNTKSNIQVQLQVKF